MKKFVLFFVLFFITIYSQEVKQVKINDSLAKILLENNVFQKNPYDKKYLLISDHIYGNKKLARVRTGKGWGFIDKSGKEIVPAIFDETYAFSNNIYCLYKKSDSDNQKIKCNKAFNFKGKEIAEICQPDYSNARKIEYIGNFLKITEDRNKTGIVDLEGNFIIPPQYTDIQLFGNYFFCENFGQGINSVFDQKGKFIKTIPSVNIQNFMEKKNLVQVIDTDDKRYLLNLKTLEPATEKYDWGQFQDYSDNPDLYIEHYDYYDKRKSYILNKNFEIINKDYPDCSPFLDKYLIYKEYPSDTITILNLKGKVIAKYFYDDYKRFSFFVPGRLDNPEYIEKNKARFLKYKKIQSINHKDSDRDLYRFFYDLGDPVVGKTSSYYPHNSFNIIETQNGEILFSLPPENIENASYIDAENPLFMIFYTDNTTKIFDKKGNLQRTFDCKIEKSGNYYQTVSNDGEKRTLLDKNFQKVFPDEITSYSQIQDDMDVFFVGNGTHFGIMDKNGKIIKPLTYNSIKRWYITRNEDLYEFLSDNTYGVFDPKSLETEISFITRGIKVSFDGDFFLFGNSAYIDKYGNYFQNYVEPPPRIIFYEK